MNDQRPYKMRSSHSTRDLANVVCRDLKAQGIFAVVVDRNSLLAPPETQNRWLIFVPQTERES